MRRDRPPLQQLSKRLFNSENRLAVASALLVAPGLLTVDEAARASAVSRTSTHTELVLLAEVGLAKRLVAGRSVAYQRVDGPFWEWIRELLSMSAHLSVGDG